tara:strand:+ start:79 stop:183 length:105 start_codon:yes stop_codon:yes gene_type:complete
MVILDVLIQAVDSAQIQELISMEILDITLATAQV